MFSIKSVVAIAVVRVAGCLPLCSARTLGRLIGKMAWLSNTKMAVTTAQNIERCFPAMSEQEQSSLAKQSLCETGALALETCVLYHRPTKWISKLFQSVAGEDLIQKALESNKGLLVIAPHLGNWEIIGWYLANLGPVTNMYRPPKLASIDRLVLKNRQRSGAKLVGIDRKGLAQFLKALKQGEMAGILPDQTPRAEGSGMFAPFFSQPAYTMTLVHKLIQRSSCSVVFAYAKRVPRGYEIIIRPAPQGIYSEDEATSVMSLNVGVEDCVKDIPEQYQWEYGRFRKRP